MRQSAADPAGADRHDMHTVASTSVTANGMLKRAETRRSRPTATSVEVRTQPMSTALDAAKQVALVSAAMAQGVAELLLGEAVFSLHGFDIAL